VAVPLGTVIEAGALTARGFELLRATTVAPGAGRFSVTVRFVVSPGLRDVGEIRTFAIATGGGGGGVTVTAACFDTAFRDASIRAEPGAFALTVTLELICPGGIVTWDGTATTRVLELASRTCVAAWHGLSSRTLRRTDPPTRRDPGAAEMDDKFGSGISTSNVALPRLAPSTAVTDARPGPRPVSITLCVAARADTVIVRGTAVAAGLELVRAIRVASLTGRLSVTVSLAGCPTRTRGGVMVRPAMVTGTPAT